MQRMRINPFFDGEAPRRPAAPTPAATATEGEEYIDASRVMNQQNRPLSSLVPQGIPGLRNVVIPHASDEGVPIGNNPHNRNRILRVDPHLPGESSDINLNDLTPARVSGAIRAAAEALDIPPRDLPSRRLHGAAAMHLAASAAVARHAERAPVEAAPRQSQRRPVPRPQPQPQPLHSFFDSPPQRQGPVGRQRPLDLSEAPREAVSEPTQAVIFENQDRSRQQAWYHSVQVENGFLVFVFDTRYRGPRYMAPSIQQAGDSVVLGAMLAVNIVGTADVFYVFPTPFVYSYEDREHTIMMIRSRGPMPGAEESYDDGETGGDSPGDHASDDDGA